MDHGSDYLEQLRARQARQAFGRRQWFALSAVYVAVAVLVAWLT